MEGGAALEVVCGARQWEAARRCSVGQWGAHLVARAIKKIDAALGTSRYHPQRAARCLPLAGAAHHLERSAALYWPDPSPKPVRKMSRCAK
jgi:hypothetical protein